MNGRRLLTAVLVVASLASAAVMGRLVVDNRLERWFGDTGDDARRYQAFQREFGSDEFLLAIVGGGDFFEPGTLEELLTVAEQLEDIPGVTRVSGLPILYRDLFGAEDAEALELEVGATEFFDGLFISADGEEIGLWLQVSAPDDPQGRRRIVEAASEALQPLRSEGRKVSVVGSPALIVALDTVSQEQARKSLPIAFVGSILMLAWMLRSLRAMVPPVVSAAMTVLITLGLAVVLGISVNMVTTALPALLWVLALSNGIHIVRRYQVHRHHRPPTEAMGAALAETTRACVLAAITTAAGFGSLAAAGMAPVREFGWLAAAGILVSLVVNLTVVPVAAVAFRVPGTEGGRGAGGGRWAWGWRTHPWWVVAVTVVVMAAGVASLPLLRVESDPVSFLPSGHETSAAYRSFSGKLGGFYTLEVILHTPAPWYEPDVWPTLDKLKQQIESEDMVTGVISPVDVLRLLNHWNRALAPGTFVPPADPQEAATLLENADPSARELLRGLVVGDGRTVRLSLMIREMEEGRFLGLVERVRKLFDDLPSGWRGEVTGQVLELVRAQQSLVTTQLRSFAVAFVLVFGCIALGLRSLRLTATAFVPNLVPTLTTFGVMVAFGVPLDAATVMVASIALGIAVDNTVHVLEHVRRRMVDGVAVGVAVVDTLRDIGPAMVATTVTACVGFLALCLSDFGPIRAFGLLATVAMVAALVADLVVLPAILVVRER